MSPNVVGVMEGSDPLLKDQYIILSAHFDHLGVIPRDPKSPLDADTIYNGAVDNATGVAQVIAQARAFAAQPRPERTLVFMSVAAVDYAMGSQQQIIRLPQALQGRFDIGGVGIGRYRLFVVALCTVLVIALQLIL